MPGKHLTSLREILSWLGALFLVSAVNPARAESTNAVASAPKFLGASSCSSSGCHGGADDLSKQYTIWAQYDFHHERPVATLATARSERLANVLKLGNPAQSSRCTVCHAPFQTVPAARLATAAHVTEGVSCETCHAAAEDWLRSHTRKDYTHADRVAAGMRDLKNPYVRANTCVACHQNVSADLLNAGHPELIFELDGQCVTQPKHWRKEFETPGAQLWFIGQAVALREMSWQLATEKDSPGDATNRWAGLLWLLQQVKLVPEPDARLQFEPIAAASTNADLVRASSDLFAQQLTRLKWNDTFTRECLLQLANTSAAFTDGQLAPAVHARRAERLVLALDRLTQALPATRDPANDSLNRLFAAAQSIPDFNLQQFAKELKEFHTRVTGVLESK